MMSGAVDERIKQFSMFVLAGAVIAATSLAGFALIAASALAPFRYLVLLAYIAASLGLFCYAARIFGVAWLLILASIIAVLSTAIEQILGFGFFPGLVKDLNPFESAHLQSLARIFAALLGWHSCLALLASMLARRDAQPPSHSDRAPMDRNSIPR